MARATTNVSVVVTVHDEARLLHRTLMSIERSARFAKRHGIKVDLVVVAYSPSESTKAYINNHVNKDIAVGYAVKTLATTSQEEACNAGVKVAKSELVSLVPAGDLVSEKWLAEAAQQLAKTAQPTVLYPMYRYQFGDQYKMSQTPASTAKDFQAWQLVENDIYPAVLMSMRTLLQEYPVTRVRRSWTADTLAAKIKHLPVKETMCASSFELNGSPDVVMPHSGYFDSLVLTRSNKSQAGSEQPDTKDKLLSAASKLTNYSYHSYVGRKLRNLNSRLDTYATGLRNETLHLLRPRSSAGAQPALPAWLYEEVRSLNSIDLRVYYLEHVGTSLQYPAPSITPYIQAYADLLSKVVDKPDILFLVPYVKNGGAERELMYMTDAFLELHPKAKIIMLATEPSDSPWASNLNPKISFIEPDQAFRQLSVQDQARLLTQMCMQKQPRKLHVMNSQSGYFMLEKYAQTLSESMDIFLTIFSIDRTTEGMPTHTFAYRMQSAIDYVTKVFTDNQTVIDQLTDTMALDASKFQVLYQPSETDRIQRSYTVIKQRFAKPPLRLLWAGRIDRQKRPDVLVEIADEVKRRKLPVTIDVYGSPAFDGNYLQAIEAHQAINYRGPFDGGLKTLPTEQYDAFLLTSEWEGMPNVLLEATAEGLLLIAPDVGGVAEFVISEQTGHLIEQFDNVSSYIDSLQHILNNPAESRKLISGAQALAQKRHSHSSFKQQIAAQKEYNS